MTDRMHTPFRRGLMVSLVAMLGVSTPALAVQDKDGRDMMKREDLVVPGEARNLTDDQRDEAMDRLHEKRKEFREKLKDMDPEERKAYLAKLRGVRREEMKERFENMPPEKRRELLDEMKMRREEMRDRHEDRMDRRARREGHDRLDGEIMPDIPRNGNRQEGGERHGHPSPGGQGVQNRNPSQEGGHAR